MDPEFNCLGKLIIGKDLNTAASRDHLPEIERKIKVVKERIRALHSSLPYDHMTRHMIIEVEKYVVMMINSFPPKSGIS